MFPALQQHRPQVQQPRPLPNRQQHRTFHVEPASAAELVTSSPQNQIEAMPPSHTMPNTPKMLMHTVAPQFNPATTHPVFFMNSYRKPPFPLPINAACNPVATGYVFGKNNTGTVTKL